MLVEDVAGSQTSVKVEEIGAKVDKLESIIESTLPRGCLTHWRIVDKTTGELINQGMLDNSMNNAGKDGDNSTLIVYKAYNNGNQLPSVVLAMNGASGANVMFNIPKVDTNTQKVELYNPYDTSVAVLEVTTVIKYISTPIYLKHLPPHPTDNIPVRFFYYPNGRDVYVLKQAMGFESSAESSNTVIGLLKSISNKL